MNQIEAMRDTLALAELRGMDNITSDYPDVDYPHLKDMFIRAQAGHEDGQPFSESKLGRWLGWMQCAIYSGGHATLDELKAINKGWANK